MKRLPVLLIFISFIFASCSDNGVKNSKIETNTYLSDYELIRDLSRDEIKGVFSSIISLLPNVKYDIKVYRVEYNTKNIDGTDIVASGVLVIPETETGKPMVSYQHGTIFLNESAPSKFYDDSYVDEGTLIASMGMPCVIPDYLGYGITNYMLHPYQHASSLGRVSADLIRAGNELLKELGFSDKKDLFLTGYSEGGYATIALLKELEEKHPDEYNIIGVSAGAGAYNMEQTAMDFLTADDEIENPAYPAFVVWSYNDIYNLGKSADYYFNQPYAQDIEDGLLKGDLGYLAINSLPEKVHELFTEEYVNAVSNREFTSFINALIDNNIYDFVPRAPVKLFHGTADKDVYYQNSVDFYEYATANGANDIELITLYGKTHITAIADWMLQTLVWLISLDDA